MSYTYSTIVKGHGRPLYLILLLLRRGLLQCVVTPQWLSAFVCLRLFLSVEATCPPRQYTCPLYNDYCGGRRPRFDLLIYRRLFIRTALLPCLDPANSLYPQVMARNIMALEGNQMMVALVGIFHVDGIENILMDNGWQFG